MIPVKALKRLGVQGTQKPTSYGMADTIVFCLFFLHNQKENKHTIN